MKTTNSPSPAADLLEHRLQALLELAAVLGARHQLADVERDEPLVLERLGHVAVDDALRQPLDDGRLADARLPDQHRVVLGAAREHLDHAADLLVAADDRVELAGAGLLGEVAGEALERLVLRLRAVVGDRCARPARRERGEQVVARDARRRRAARGPSCPSSSESASSRCSVET